MDIELEGQIEKISFRSEQDGFTIAKVNVRGELTRVTVVGKMFAPAPGEIIKMTGQWVTHPRFGRQFKMDHYEGHVPVSVQGIKKYLGSGLIKGIGPVMAEKIVGQFGIDTFDIIEKRVERLVEVEGIGNKRISMIKDAWEEQKEIREVMLFLQGHGVSSGYAAKIFRQYGKKAIEVVRSNPYRLASDIFGIGFLVADSIAEKLGFSKDSKLRIEAGVLFVLRKFADDGHVFSPYERLIEKCRKILCVDREIIVHAISTLAGREAIYLEDLNENLEAYKENSKAVYLSWLFSSENGVAERIKALNGFERRTDKISDEKAKILAQGQVSINLARNQLLAVRHTLLNNVTVITGGPGTGKTTIIKAIIEIFDRFGSKTLLAAPTGRAAKRMSETTRREAKTIHRMLEYSMRKGGFQRHAGRPLECDLLIIDEASMIDIVLMHQLLVAVPDGATIVLVGDVNQLPSVGAGTVLKDIIDSKTVPVIELNEIFRQARQSRIIVNAHRIKSGMLPLTKDIESRENDFYFIEQEDAQEVLRIIISLVTERIPMRFGLDPVRDVQVISPMHKGITGTDNLNKELQDVLNKGNGILSRGNRSYKVGDKVLQVKNNYEKEVFNGDIGTISRIENDQQFVIIAFDGREVPYDFSELDEIMLAYAVSVHKSQGSEYPAVIIPLMPQHYMLLQRNLIYTAITRASRLVVLVGSRKALSMAVNNDKTHKRNSILKARLRS